MVKHSMLRGWFAALLMTSSLAASCGKSSSKGDAPPKEEPSATTELTPESVADGAVTATVSASSKDTLVLNASGGSGITGSSLSFPPGSLAVDVAVTLEAGVSLADDTIAQDLGIASAGVTLAAAGPAVVLTANPSINALNPFSLALALPEGSGLAPIDLTNLIVVFKRIDAATGELTIGVIPKDALDIQATTVYVSTTKFGVYQLMTSSALLSQPIEVATAKPIQTVREEIEKPTTPVPDGDKTAPTIVLQTAKGIIEKTATLRIVYSEAIKLTTVTLTKKMAAAAKVELAKTNVKDDTVVISPKTSWVAGSAEDLTVNAKDLADNPAVAVTLEFDVVDKIFYVRPTGDDANNGTAADPFQTIGRAVSEVVESELVTYVFVAAGTYSENLSLNKGVRLIGGFPVGSWAVRDVAANISKIEAPSGSSPVTIGNNGGTNPVEKVEIRGFSLDTVAGAGGGYAVYIPAGSPVPVELYENTMRMRHTDGGAGIHAVRTSLIAVGNTIETVATTSGSNGIYVYNTEESVIIARNTIKTGFVSTVSNGPYSVYITDSNGGTDGYVEAQIHDNVLIMGPTKNTDSGGTGYGINASQVTFNARNNTIIGTAGQHLYGIYFSHSGVTPLVNIENNSFDVAGTSTSICIFLNGDNGALGVIKNNNFQSCGGGAVDDNDALYKWSSSYYDDAAALNAAAFGGGNSELAPGYVDTANNNYRLTTSSALKAKGINGASAITSWDMFGGYKDRDGVPRGTAWSIGAYQ